MEVRRYVMKFLHGKAHLFGDSIDVRAALVTSANLTAAGMWQNLELGLVHYDTFSRAEPGAGSNDWSSVGGDVTSDSAARVHDVGCNRRVAQMTARIPCRNSRSVSRQLVLFSRYIAAMDSDVVDWQGRQIVQS